MKIGTTRSQWRYDVTFRSTLTPPAVRLAGRERHHARGRALNGAPGASLNNEKWHASPEIATSHAGGQGKLR
jgi:hypothetical protein